MSGSAGYRRAGTPHPHSRIIHIVRGDPSEEELAALVAVLAGPANGRAGEPAAARSAWADPARRLRAPLHPGPGAWRARALPY